MPLTADDRIILIRVKIERAKKCLHELESELIRFGNQHVYVASANEPKFAQSTPNLSAQRTLPFDALSIAGDVVHNLRSALDYLAHQLVWAGSDAEPLGLQCMPSGQAGRSGELSGSVSIPMATSVDEHL